MAIEQIYIFKVCVVCSEKLIKICLFIIKLFCRKCNLERQFSKKQYKVIYQVYVCVCVNMWILWKMRRKNDDRLDRKSTRTIVPEPRNIREDKESNKGRQTKYARSLLLRSSHARGWCNKLHLDYMKTMFSYVFTELPYWGDTVHNGRVESLHECGDRRCM